MNPETNPDVRRRRGAYQSYVNIMYGIGSASGAALGGVMADGLGWRWEFGIQVPPILLTLAITAWVIPRDLGVQGKRETLLEAAKAFDFAGSLLLTTSITFLILGLVSCLLPFSTPLSLPTGHTLVKLHECELYTKFA